MKALLYIFEFAVDYLGTSTLIFITSYILSSSNLFLNLRHWTKYKEQGDIIGYQYGGSQLVHTLQSYRGQNPLEELTKLIS